jgi:hypothetical protein
MNSPLIVNQLIWLDANVSNFENTQLIKSFSKILPNLIIYPCDSLEKGFEQLYKFDFELTFVMISGRLFEGYIMKLKNEFILLKSIPLSIVYTSKDGKEQLEGKKTGNYAFNPATLASVNDPFLNPGGVCDHPKEIAQFIIRFNQTYYDENYYKESKFKENLHSSVNLQSYFIERINCVDNLILPAIYSKLFLINELSDNETMKFIEFVLNLDNNKSTKNLLFPLFKLKKIPIEIIIKFVFKAFSNDEVLFNILNKNLILSQNSSFSTFIKLMYKGLENFSLSTNFSRNLYKLFLMKQEDLFEIEKNYDNYIKTNKSLIPFCFLFFKHFIDFETDINNVNEFKEKNFTNEVCVLLEVLKSDNKNFYSFNIDSKGFINNSTDKVYLFPYIPLFVTNFGYVNSGKIKAKKITLKYLENYQEEVNEFKFNKDNYFNKFLKFEFTKQALYNPNLHEVNESIDSFKNNITLIFKNNDNLAKEFNVFSDQNNDAPPAA